MIETGFSKDYSYHLASERKLIYQKIFWEHEEDMSYHYSGGKTYYGLNEIYELGEENKIKPLIK